MVNEPPLASASPPNLLVNVATLLARVVTSGRARIHGEHDAGKQRRYIQVALSWLCTRMIIEYFFVLRISFWLALAYSQVPHLSSAIFADWLYPGCVLEKRARSFFSNMQRDSEHFIEISFMR